MSSSDGSCSRRSRCNWSRSSSSSRSARPQLLLPRPPPSWKLSMQTKAPSKGLMLFRCGRRRLSVTRRTSNVLSVDVTKKCLVPEGWCPAFVTKKIQDALQHAAFDSNAQVGAAFQVLHTKGLPPTYFLTNKFT